MKTEKWLNNEIRFIEKDGEWWAVASDIAKALEFKKTRDATKRIPDKYKGETKVPTLGGEQKMLILNERGIYRMIMRSNKPQAEEFQDFVYSVIQELRQASGLEGFEVFRQLDKEHQKEQMKKLRDGLEQPARVDFIKANTITNKCVSTKHGYDKMIKKGDMTPEMLLAREQVLENTVEVMKFKDKYKMDISISDVIYKQHGN